MSLLPKSGICLGVTLVVALQALIALEPAHSGIAGPVPSLQATDLNSTACRLPAVGASATVLFFVIHDCPICNRYAPEINRISSDYKSRGVASYVVYVESDFSAAQAAQHAKEYGFQCGLLRDPRHQLSKSTGADVAPEAVLMSSDGSIVYRGRIDNTFVTFGMKRAHPTTHDLRNAMDALLAGAPIATTSTPVIGCAIPKD